METIKRLDGVAPGGNCGAGMLGLPAHAHLRTRTVDTQRAAADEERRQTESVRGNPMSAEVSASLPNRPSGTVVAMARRRGPCSGG